MKAKSFDLLENCEKEKLFALIKSFSSSTFFGSMEEMNKYYGGISFEDGKSFITFWQEDYLIGSIGVVTREAYTRGEIFITGFFIREQDVGKVDFILKEALKFCKSYKNVKLKLGVRAGAEYIIPTVVSLDFKEVYKLLELRLDKKMVVSDTSRLEFRELDADNIKSFQRINNSAFLNSPNGSGLDDSELDELLEEYKDKPRLAAIAYKDNIPAGIYTLSIKNNVGWIDSIGVDPQYQGKGIGRDILMKSIEILKGMSVEGIRLTVISSNLNAVQLYLKSGFINESVLSTWFEKAVD